MNAPEFWIIAGPNGAGKTTSVSKEPASAILPGVTFHNPDERTLTKLRALGFHGFADAPESVQTGLFIQSAEEVFAELSDRLARDEPVGVETVLSSTKYCPLVDDVLSRNGFFGLIYIVLATPALAQERVATRVREGGHGVPEKKIEERWKRSLQYLSWFAANASAFWVFDNSDSEDAIPPRLLASGQSGCLDILDDSAIPELKATLSSL